MRAAAVNVAIASVAMIGLTAVAFAQASAPEFNSGSAIRDIWEFAKGAGPFGTVLMWYVWQRSDNERRKLQGERDALLERVLTANNAHLNEITGIRQLLQTAMSGGRSGP